MTDVPTLYLAKNKERKIQIIEFISIVIEDNEEPEDLSAESYIMSCVEHASEKHNGDWEPILVLRLPEGTTIDKPTTVLGCYFAEAYVK